MSTQILDQIKLDTHYHYDILQPKHIDSVVKMFTRSFCDCEPMTQYIGMTYAGFHHFAQAVTEKAADEGLSIVANDETRVIACALVEDLTNPLAINFELDPKFGPIFNLLEQLSTSFFTGKTIEINHIAHLFITAVDPAYQHRGLSKQINFRAMALARSRGFNLMLSELTNIYNEKGILNHLRYESLLLKRIQYNEFIFENSQPFKNLDGSAAGYLWQLHPDARFPHPS